MTKRRPRLDQLTDDDLDRLHALLDTAETARDHYIATLAAIQAQAADWAELPDAGPQSVLLVAADAGRHLNRLLDRQPEHPVSEAQRQRLHAPINLIAARIRTAQQDAAQQPPATTPVPNARRGQ